MKEKKPTPKPENPEQSKRFVKIARELESDESGEAFERALKIINPPSKAKRRKPASP